MVISIDLQFLFIWLINHISRKEELAKEALQNKYNNTGLLELLYDPEIPVENWN